ncbi:MAG: hypothetical protein JJU33_06635 [Phycisphaerales bacterium]|nr:hypothetical protein [Phycisphaerales bacterium]
MDRQSRPGFARACSALAWAAAGVLLFAPAGCYKRVTGTRGVGASGMSTERSDLESDPVGKVLFGEPEVAGRRERMSSWGSQAPAQPR